MDQRLMLFDGMTESVAKLRKNNQEEFFFAQGSLDFPFKGLHFTGVHLKLPLKMPRENGSYSLCRAPKLQIQRVGIGVIHEPDDLRAEELAVVPAGVQKVSTWKCRQKGNTNF